MRRSCLLLILAAGFVMPALSQRRALLPYVGRWDLTIDTPGGSYPSWMEVSDKDGMVVVLIVGRESALHGSDNVKLEPHPVTTVPGLNESAVVMGEKTVLSRLSFTTSEWFGKQIPVTWEIDGAPGGKITGTQKRSDGVEGQIKGERAPLLKRKPPVRWSDPKALFNGTDLTGWEPGNAAVNHWKVIDGALTNEAAGANLRTSEKFEDFKLHIEYKCPKGGNSGVYLRGRYEIQIEYEPEGKNGKSGVMGSIYGFLAPSVEVPPRPGEWESYDVTLVGRNVTVMRDGILIIDNKPIPGITGGALDSREASPGPLILQGDHTGGMQFRNITLSLPAR